MDSREPIDYQEIHSPTAPTEIVISHTPRRVKAGPRRRLSDKRLWEGLTEDERRAWVEIDKVWAHITHGMTAKAQLFERRDKGRTEPPVVSSWLTECYRRWRLRVAAAERSVVMEIIFEGKSPSRVSKERRKNTHWGRKVLGEALGRWNEIAGRC